MSSHKILRMYQRNSRKTPGLDEQTTTGAWLFVARTELNAPALYGMRSGAVTVASGDVCFRADSVAKVFLWHGIQILRALGATIE